MWYFGGHCSAACGALCVSFVSWWKGIWTEASLGFRRSPVLQQNVFWNSCNRENSRAPWVHKEKFTKVAQQNNDRISWLSFSAITCTQLHQLKNGILENAKYQNINVN